tara:strand:+ start:193 stop:528 length:336 start_codon:yes stop_codon:yes gene_type:complete
MFLFIKKLNKNDTMSSDTKRLEKEKKFHDQLVDEEGLARLATHKYYSIQQNARTYYKSLIMQQCKGKKHLNMAVDLAVELKNGQEMALLLLVLIFCHKVLLNLKNKAKQII